MGGSKIRAQQRGLQHESFSLLGSPGLCKLEMKRGRNLTDVRDNKKTHLLRDADNHGIYLLC